MPGGNISELKVDGWMRMVDINIKGVLNTMAGVLPDFIEQKSGYIIVTSSIECKNQFPEMQSTAKLNILPVYYTKYLLLLVLTA